MSPSDIFKVVSYIIGGLGGISAVIYAVIRFSANRIAERLSAKYELQLTKELELFKKDLEEKQHISKTRFDTEFVMYKELTKCFFEMALHTTSLFPPGLTTKPANEEEKEKLEREKYANANDSFLKAQNTFYESIHFVTEKLDEQFKELLGVCRLQISFFGDRYNIC